MNEMSSNLTLTCSICLRTFSSSSTNFARCSNCNLVIERDCLSALIPGNQSLATWSCLRCLKSKDKTVNCDICGFSDGFFLPLKMPNGSSKNWIHPFCGCFHKEFKKDKKHNFFQWENTEHLTKNQLKLQEKQNKSLPPCIYCKRKFGHKKLCTSCNKEYMHSICAYKNNSLLSFLECTSDNERKLNIKELLCTNCISQKDGVFKIEEEKSNIDAQLRLMEASTSEEHQKEEAMEIDSEKRTIKKHNEKYHYKAQEILEGIIEFIIKADELKIFSKKYCKFPIDLISNDVEVIFI